MQFCAIEFVFLLTTPCERWHTGVMAWLEPSLPECVPHFAESFQASVEYAKHTIVRINPATAQVPKRSGGEDVHWCTRRASIGARQALELDYVRA